MSVNQQYNKTITFKPSEPTNDDFDICSDTTGYLWLRYTLANPERASTSSRQSFGLMVSLLSTAMAEAASPN